MGKYYFHYEIGMKTPTVEFRNGGFVPHAEDINEAITAYNSYYNEIREAILLSVTEYSCHILLIVKEGGSIAKTAKDLIILSKHLYNDKDWKRYSREPNTLFYLKRIQQYDAFELQDLFEEFGKDVYAYLDQEDTFEFPEDEIIIEKGEEDILDTSGYDNLSEDQCIALMKYLFSIRTIGSAERCQAKAAAISKIKAVLYQFI